MIPYRDVRRFGRGRKQGKLATRNKIRAEAIGTVEDGANAVAKR